MSAFVSEPTRFDEDELATAGNGETLVFVAQKHRSSLGGSGESYTMTSRGGDEGASEVEISAVQKMLSAVSGSLLTSLLVTPLDVVRVRLQSQPSSSTLSSLRTPSRSTTPFSNLPPNLGVTACCREVFWVNNNAQYCVATNSTLSVSSHTTNINVADCAIDETRRKTFTSTLDGLRKIARYEGLSSLWRGLSPTLLMAVPANVIYFTGYDSLRFNPHSPIKTYVNDAYAPLLAGSIARVAAASVISPVEMFRTRMQATSGASTSVFKNTLLGLTEMVKSQGYTSLWRGLTLTMWRDVPFSGLYWWGYEATRNALTDIRDRNRGRTLDPLRGHTRKRSHSQHHENHTTTFVDSFVAGAASGAVAAIVTTPFDVGKTRQQVLQHSDDFKTSASSSPASLGAGNERGATPPEGRSVPRFLYHIWRTEGTAGLFRGWAARCLKVAPACAIMISSYEIGKKMARNINEKREAKVETPREV